MRFVRAAAHGVGEDDRAITEIDRAQSRGENADIGFATADRQCIDIEPLQIGVQPTVNQGE